MPNSPSEIRQWIFDAAALAVLFQKITNNIASSRKPPTTDYAEQPFCA
jgi:hypothetical protein